MSSSVKFLGVHLDSNLSWKVHVDYIYKKLIKFIPLFYRIRSLIPAVILKHFYYAFIYPHLEYGIELYLSSRNNYASKIFVLNNKLLRILQFSYCRFIYAVQYS